MKFRECLKRRNKTTFETNYEGKKKIINGLEYIFTKLAKRHRVNGGHIIDKEKLYPSEFIV